MTPIDTPRDAENLTRLARIAMDKVRACCPGKESRWLLVDVWGQQIALVQMDQVKTVWPVSTAEAGLDNRHGSGGTPPGLHRVARKIGDGAPSGTVFESRRPTGTIWEPPTGGPDPADASDLILTRILTLDGLEPGVNQGPGVDSNERYIYIHGTNHEDAVGEPESGGCVRMKNTDIVSLFDLVEEGDPVVIA